ncbi:MAG TPA: universal stress protein [Candidatus Baltobacteraceae bacterium]|nr:universal stress protein [Candidatus Baltobacteraceae bacterium]
MKIKLSRAFGNTVVNVAAEDEVDLSVHMKKILVPLDFSVCSKKALQYAIPLAKHFKAEIIFLHVIPVHFNYADNEIEFEPGSISGTELQTQVGRKLASLIQELVPDEIPVDAEVRYGVEAAEIVNAAKKSEVDVIILSTHGRTGRAHSLVGSVAEDVVRMAPCPVLVVRERQHEFVEFTQKTVTANAA